MENASKALLIAGAILVVILIIAVGMIVYNSSKGTIDEAISQMSSTEKETFNSQFKQLAGNNRNGSQLSMLLDKIESNNTTYDGTGKVIAVNYANNKDDTPSKSTVKDIRDDLVSSRSYKIAVDDTNGDGLVDTVSVNALVNK